MRVTLEYEGQKYGARFEDTATTEAVVTAIKNTLSHIRGEQELPILTPEGD